MNDTKKARGGNLRHIISLQAYYIPRDKLKSIDFKAINNKAIASLGSILSSWLPNGRLEGNEYVALNPTRHDQNYGSFRINMHSANWADFSTGDKGGDVVSLIAYLDSVSQYQAAQKLKNFLGE